jgi:1-acyl-sn-glycerol-3-phosphate acyltransferase
MERLRVSDADPWLGALPGLPAPPPLPDSSGFVAPSVPSPAEALAAFLRALGRDLDGGRRVLGRAAWLLGIAAVCLPPHLLCRALGGSSPWNRWFMRWATRACGIRVEVVGQPLRRDVFFIANHLSWTDALILGGVTGTAFVAQHGIAIWPGLNFLCRMNDTIFVNRSERLRVDEQVAALRAQFAERSTLALFAEGTTSDGRRLLPFKASLLAMLVPPPRRACVQPVVIDCDEAGRDLAWIGLETGAQNAWRLLARPGTWRVRVHFLEPFDPAEMPDRKALAARARGAILERLSATLRG